MAVGAAMTKVEAARLLAGYEAFAHALPSDEALALALELVPDAWGAPAFVRMDFGSASAAWHEHLEAADVADLARKMPGLVERVGDRPLTAWRVLEPHNIATDSDYVRVDVWGPRA